MPALSLDVQNLKQIPENSWAISGVCWRGYHTTARGGSTGLAQLSIF
jgi:hypothetical protein